MRDTWPVLRQSTLRRSVPIGFVALALVFASCGGSDDDASDTVPATDAPEPEPEPVMAAPEPAPAPIPAPIPEPIAFAG